MASPKTIVLGTVVLSGTDVGTYVDIQRKHDDLGAVHIHLSGTPGDLAGTLNISGRISKGGTAEIALNATNLATMGGAEKILTDFPLLPQMRITTVAAAGTPPVTLTVYLME